MEKGHPQSAGAPFSRSLKGASYPPFPTTHLRIPTKPLTWGLGYAPCPHLSTGSLRGWSVFMHPSATHRVNAVIINHPSRALPPAVQRRIDRLPHRQQLHLREFMRRIYACQRRRRQDDAAAPPHIWWGEIQVLFPHSDPRSLRDWTRRAVALGLIRVVTDAAQVDHLDVAETQGAGERRQPGSSLEAPEPKGFSRSISTAQNAESPCLTTNPGPDLRTQILNPPRSADGGVTATQARPQKTRQVPPLFDGVDACCDEIALLEAQPQPKPAPLPPPDGLTPAAEATQAAMAMLNAARQKRGDAFLPAPDTAAPPEPEPPEDTSAPPQAAQPRQAPADGMTDAQRYQRHLEHSRKDFVPIQGPPEPLTEHACEQVAAIDPSLNHPRSAAQWLRRELHQAGVCGQLLQRGVLAYRHQLTKQVIHFPLSYIRKAALNQRALQLKHEAGAE